MSEPSKIQRAVAFLENKVIPLWNTGDRLSYEELHQLAQFSPAKVQPLFAASEVVGATRFTVELKCSICFEMRDRDMSKTALLALFAKKSKRAWYGHQSISEWTCVQCASKAEQKWEADNEIRQLNAQREKVKRTEEAIATIGAPGSRFTGDKSLWWRSLQDRLQWIDLDQFAAHLIGLPYLEFLSTPYWQAIAARVKYRAHFKCQLCSGSERLAAHHRDYSTHGHEAENLTTLICLCENCHQTFHDKLP